MKINPYQVLINNLVDLSNLKINESYIMSDPYNPEIKYNVDDVIYRAREKLGNLEMINGEEITIPLTEEIPGRFLTVLHVDVAFVLHKNTWCVDKVSTTQIFR